MVYGTHHKTDTHPNFNPLVSNLIGDTHCINGNLHVAVLTAFVRVSILQGVLYKFILVLILFKDPVP